MNACSVLEPGHLALLSNEWQMLTFRHWPLRGQSSRHQGAHDWSHLGRAGGEAGGRGGRQGKRCSRGGWGRAQHCRLHGSNKLCTLGSCRASCAPRLGRLPSKYLRSAKMQSVHGPHSCSSYLRLGARVHNHSNYMQHRRASCICDHSASFRHDLQCMATP
eukprot:12302451-Alexandrium_andersonii.AAC.1